MLVENFAFPLSILKRFNKNFEDPVSERTPSQRNKLTFHDEKFAYDSNLAID